MPSSSAPPRGWSSSAYAVAPPSASWSWAATPSDCCSSSSRISRVVVTPVAFGDPPLLNVVGVHQPYALRAIVELHTDSGLLGLGETYADEAHLARLEAVATVLGGHDPYDLHGLLRSPGRGRR